MKLVYKNILINTIVSVCILFMGEYAIFYFIKSKIEKEAIEHLNLEGRILRKKIKKGIAAESFNNNIGDYIEVEKIIKPQILLPVITDVEMEEEWEEEHFTSKKITFDVIQNNQPFRVSITKTIDEDEDITGSMTTIFIVSGMGMLLVIILINYFAYQRLFNPIYILMREIRSFSITSLQKISAPPTSTVEFDIIGQEIGKMSEKIISDYTSVKEFTENITHEIQTPLAVINFKIERCLQDKNLTAEQALFLSDAAKAVDKLFNISKGLTLLSKLDNKEYTNLKEVNITGFLKQRLSYFSDFIDQKKLTVETNLNEETTLTVDPALCEILIDNILKNAIRHNLPNGRLIISLENKQLTISNSGETPDKPVEEFFNRFSRKDPSATLGLGLSIVKKIVEYYGYQISYSFHEGIHSVSIRFV